MTANSYSGVIADNLVSGFTRKERGLIVFNPELDEFLEVSFTSSTFTITSITNTYIWDSGDAVFFPWTEVQLKYHLDNNSKITPHADSIQFVPTISYRRANGNLACILIPEYRFGYFPWEGAAKD